ncbi:MAG: flavodoxin family protein [Dehalococcoidales bacterium]|nr:flavodoxin family protein [Dehalococcoidales bacterium]
MNILGISCSPRLEGNTEIMVRESLNAARENGAEVELVTLAGKNIMPCDSCLSCDKTKQCKLNDDMQDIYTKLLAANGIIFGTPLYYQTVSAQAKALIDRTFLFRQERNLRNKLAAVAVATGGGDAVNAVDVFKMFFNIQRMKIAGIAVGKGSYKKGSVSKDIQGIMGARNLGKRISDLLKI